MSAELKLKATDPEDLEVIAACLQDAVLPVGEMTYQPALRRFVMVASRFRWEDAEGPIAEGRVYERVHSGVRFDRVNAVRLKGIEQGRRSHILSLLTMKADDSHVDLIFAGGGVIRLETDGLVCHLEDIDEPWPTQWKPAHPESGTEE